MVLNYMYQARKVLYRQLHSEEISQELVEGIEMLANALELAENPDKTIHVCPRCDSVHFDEIATGALKCLSCDGILIHNKEEIRYAK